MNRRPVHSRQPGLRRGFTLTELLIVMAILVLLVSLVGPRLLGSKEKADINSVKTQIGMFQTALERYKLDTGQFPSTEQGLMALVAPPSGDISGGADDLGGDLALEGEADPRGMGGGGVSGWDGPYLRTETLPKDPWGQAYAYEYPATHNRLNIPDVWSFGPDRQENSDDDIVSWTGDGTGGENLGDTPGAADEFAVD